MAKIFIVGGPGSGKSTFAEKLSSELNIPHSDNPGPQITDMTE